MSTDRRRERAAADEGSSDRKDAHLDIALRDSGVAFAGVSHGLDGWRLEYDALPEISLDEVDTSCVLFGKRMRAPLLVGAMTGGTARATALNRTLAEAAERCGVGFCLGSQRKAIASPELAAAFDVRDVAPTALILGNVGGAQLVAGASVEAVRALLDAAGCDALNVHLNPLQEAVQPEGDTDWRGVRDAIGRLAREIGRPVIVKEVGAGLSERALRKLIELPIAGVETAGVGGTSWARIEARRAVGRAGLGPKAVAGESLAAFGIPTAESIRLARSLFPDRLVVGSGGLRTGLDVATAIALGADVAAIALPFLHAAEGGQAAVVDVIEGVVETLRVTMFATGARDLATLRGVRVEAVHWGRP